jgi:hypothetical protein
LTRLTCKLLLCGPFPEPVGGVSIHLRRLMASLERAGRFEVRCIDEAALRKPGLFNLRSLNLAAYLRLLWWADVVHVQSSLALFRTLHVLAARLLGRKVVLTLHSHRPKHRLEHLLTRLVCRLPQVVVAVNEQIRADVCPRAHVIPAYIAPGSDEEWVPEDIAAWIDDARRRGKTLVVSNAYKLVQFNGEDLYGLDLLIDSFRAPAVRARHALLFVVSSLAGCEAAFARYQQRIAELGLEQDVLLVHRAMPFAGLLRRCDLSVRATNTDGDALSIRESLSYGKRTLASDCVARPAGTELFETRNVAALSALICGPAAPATPAPAPGPSFDTSIISIYGNLS